MLFKMLVGQGLFVIGLYIFVTLLVATEIGYRLGARVNRHKDAALTAQQEKGVATITSAMLALVAFMLAISISMADNRFNARRTLVLEEANAISTAYLRAQSLGGVSGEHLQRFLRDYAQLRMDFVAAGEDQERLHAISATTAVLQQQIWEEATAIATLAPHPLSALLLGSLNQVFDLSASQRWAFEGRVPFNVSKFLHFVSLLAVGVMGCSFSLSRHRHLLLSSLLLFVLSASIVLIIDLDKPRGGYIQAEQSPMLWTLESTKATAP